MRVGGMLPAMSGSKTDKLLQDELRWPSFYVGRPPKVVHGGTPPKPLPENAQFLRETQLTYETVPVTAPPHGPGLGSTWYAMIPQYGDMCYMNYYAEQQRLIDILNDPRTSEEVKKSTLEFIERAYGKFITIGED